MDWIQLNEEKAAKQGDMAKLSGNSKAVTAKSKGHEIHMYEPLLVVSAVRETVDAVRSGRPLG